MKFTLNYKIERQHKEPLVFNLQESYPLEQGILGIYGESGTGKSSLLKAIAGLTPAAQYSLFTNQSRYQNIPAEPNPCVYVGADSILFEHLNVLSNLRLVLKRSRSARACNIELDEVVSRCKIEHLLQHAVGALSSGEKQRVLFARALLSGKRVVLLDEAFSALDSSARLYFVQQLRELQDAYAVHFVMVSHSLKELTLACQSIWILEEGSFTLQQDTDSALDAMLLGADHLAEKNVRIQEKVEARRLHSEQAFSVLSLEFLERDPLDDDLEIWQLSGKDDIPAQTLIKRVRGDRQANLTESARKNQNIFRLSRCVIDADKVSLSREPLTQSSMLNCIETRVVGIYAFEDESANQAKGILIKLLANGQSIRSFISRRSFLQMDIKVGEKLYAMFKAI